MIRYPILFGFRDLIAGNDYVASVAVNGRALLVDEGDGFWMYGVNPGGLAAGGRDQGEAQLEFRQGYRSVLFDIAAKATDFDDFKAQASSFFEGTNEPTLEEWTEAVIEVRNGTVVADWLPAKDSASARFSMEVVLVDHPKPAVNELDESKLAA